jgi:uncharacterized repeat protein (TIGR04052 family)
MIRITSKKVLSFFLSIVVVLLSGCEQKDAHVSVNFQPMYGDSPLDCSSSFMHKNAEEAKSVSQQKWQYQQLQFFLYGVEIKYVNSGWQPWSMTTNSFQSDNVALLGEVCGENNTQRNWQLELAPLNNFVDATEIRFTLGVPFSLNHLNPLTQASPLNIPSMFWGWRGGHKFMRVELTSLDDDWLFHLGSTGCKAASPVRAPKEECLQTNRVVVSLPFSPQSLGIELDLAVLFRGLVLQRESSCQSDVNDENCKIIFGNLGFNSEDGREQLLFKASIND